MYPHCAILSDMKDQTAARKTPTLKTLADEVSLLRSFVMGVAGADDEGIYRPEFVEEILRTSVRATPHREFMGAGDFLRRIHNHA